MTPLFTHMRRFVALDDEEEAILAAGLDWHQPSRFYIQAIEPAGIAILDPTHLHALCAHLPQLDHCFRLSSPPNLSARSKPAENRLSRTSSPLPAADSTTAGPLSTLQIPLAIHIFLS